MKWKIWWSKVCEREDGRKGRSMREKMGQNQSLWAGKIGQKSGLLEGRWKEGKVDEREDVRKVRSMRGKMGQKYGQKRDDGRTGRSMTGKIGQNWGQTQLYEREDRRKVRGAYKIKLKY
jgi:hypothetical protein